MDTVTRLALEIADREGEEAIREYEADIADFVLERGRQRFASTSYRAWTRWMRKQGRR